MTTSASVRLSGPPDPRTHTDWVRQAVIRRAEPERLSAEQFGKLTRVQAEKWNRERAVFHANSPFVHTPQADLLLDAMDFLVTSNHQAIDEAKPALLLDGRAGQGKSAVMRHYLQGFHREQAAARRLAQAPARGSRPIDVVHISMRSATNERGLAERLRDFLELPPFKANERAMTNAVIDALFACDVKIVAIDELHFMGRSVAAGHRMSNYLKDLLNQSPCTFFFAGNDVLGSEIFRKNGQPDAAGEQFLSLVQPHAVRPFSISDRNPEWMRTLAAIEGNLRLTRQQDGDLFYRCADVVWALTSGRWRSLAQLINQACARAIATGEERLTPELFLKVPLNALSATHSAKLLATLGDGTWTSLPEPANA